MGRKGLVITNVFFGGLLLLLYLLAGMQVIDNAIDTILPTLDDTTALVVGLVHIVIIGAILMFMFRRNSIEDVELA